MFSRSRDDARRRRHQSGTFLMHSLLTTGRDLEKVVGP
jgi:hypothetical protein